MKLSDFDYELPKELIAQVPAERRDESRLIVLDRSGEGIRETRFANFPRFLMEGDVLVINETRVIPARIFGRRRSGGLIEIFLVRRLGNRQWLALLRPSKRVQGGEIIFIGEHGHELLIAGRAGVGEWRVSLPPDMEERDFIERHGHVPLPPYIKRSDASNDRERYQTVYAQHEGSVAAPTAGLHFTEDILFEIRRRGVTIVPVTLHVGPGTFRPLANETVEQNTLEAEFVLVKKANAELIGGAPREGRRVVSVGTTTTRVLEALAAGKVDNLEEREIDGERYLSGSTDLFIYPGYEFRTVDALLTNLHVPRSSLLLLVSAFAGREKILRTYRWAIARKFRFYSYGDAMFIR
jgi:S-adenosylmethionine:tRNA ribosyltransferase-isomerase